MTEERNVCNILVLNYQRRTARETYALTWRIILKRVLEKCAVMIWAGPKWLRMSQMTGIYDVEPSDCIKAGNFMTS
jgi:hypothetical protein